MAQVMEPGEKTPEQIQSEIIETREALAHKVARLESQVMSTMEKAASTVAQVQNFVSDVPDTVKQATSAVGDSVKEAFDITPYIRENPWAAIGISIGAGLLLGRLTASQPTAKVVVSAPPPPPQPFVGNASHEAPTAIPPAPAAAKSPSPLDEIGNLFVSRFRELADSALQSLTTSVKQSIESNLPKLVDTAAGQLVNTLQSSQQPGPQSSTQCGSQSKDNKG